MDADEEPIGARLKRLRRLRDMTLKEASELAGVSESFLSQVERGRSSPSLATFLRIADALGEPLAYFFPGGQENETVTRSAARGRLEHPNWGWTDTIVTPPATKHIHMVKSVIGPGLGSGRDSYVHEAQEEVVYIVDGALRVTADGHAHHLSSGDTLVLDPRRPHSFKNESSDPAIVLWIMARSPGSDAPVQH